jgi:hypothetical protein
MTAGIERLVAAAADGVAGEGRKGMLKVSAA